MDLKGYDLKNLSMLWQASSKNEELRKAIEIEMKTREQGDERFSREFLFRKSFMQNHAVGIDFLPTSQAYSRYGANITVSFLYNDQEIEELMRNVLSTPPVATYGRVKAKILVGDGFSKTQHELLANEGFLTSEILEILSL